MDVCERRTLCRHWFLESAGFAAIVPDFYHGKEMPSDRSKIMEFIGAFPVDKVVSLHHAQPATHLLLCGTAKLEHACQSLYSWVAAAHPCNQRPTPGLQPSLSCLEPSAVFSLIGYATFEAVRKACNELLHALHQACMYRLPHGHAGPFM